jgi:hypothetical protein
MRFLSKIVLAGVVTSALALSVVPSARAGDSTPRIAPIPTSPAGQTYGRWAAAWWQWAIGIPAAVNPILDTTGENCAQRQVDEVWFLAGSFLNDPEQPVVRHCAVPAGKSLFFPLINGAFGAYLHDPPEQKTEEFLRANARCTLPAQISVEIDGFDVPKPTRFFTGASGSQSPLFNVQMPSGNVLGADETAIPELALSPVAEEGYYLFVFPLDPGQHTIHFVASGCSTYGYQDITYHLTVAAQ